MADATLQIDINDSGGGQQQQQPIGGSGAWPFMGSRQPPPVPPPIQPGPAPPPPQPAPPSAWRAFGNAVNIGAGMGGGGIGGIGAGFNVGQLGSAVAGLSSGAKVAAIGLGVATAAVTGFVVAIKAANASAKEFADKLAPFSGAITAAQARNEVAAIQQQIRIAERMEHMLAKNIEAQAEFDRNWEDAKAKLTETFLPIATASLQTLNDFIEWFSDWWVTGRQVEKANEQNPIDINGAFFEFLRDKRPLPAGEARAIPRDNAQGLF